MTIDYPQEGSLFPPEIVAPTLLWHDTVAEATTWLIEVEFESVAGRLLALTAGKLDAPNIDWRVVTDGNTHSPTDYQASARAWTPNEQWWEIIKRRSVESDAVITVRGIVLDGESPERTRTVSRGSVRIRTSEDPVDALVFYRDVPLMPTTTREGVIQPLEKSMFPLLEWRLRDLSEPDAPVVMTDLPTCGNCHTFSADGKTLGMDMDGACRRQGCLPAHRSSTANGDRARRRVQLERLPGDRSKFQHIRSFLQRVARWALRRVDGKRGTVRHQLPGHHVPADVLSDAGHPRFL